MIVTDPTALSFFSGAMGLDLGLHLAGFKFKAFVEIDKTCQGTLAKAIDISIFRVIKQRAEKQ